MSAQDGVAETPPLSASARARKWCDLETEALRNLGDLCAYALTMLATDDQNHDTSALLIASRCGEVARTIVRGARVLADEDARARAHEAWERAERQREAKVAAARRRINF